MKMQHSLPRLAAAGALTLALVLCLVAWKGNPQQQQIKDNHSTDTVPDKKRNKITRESGDRDFDKELRQLEQASKNLSEKDWEKIQRDVEESIKKIDVQKIKLETDEAIQQLNTEKIKKQIEESLNRIDFDKMQQQIDESMEKASKTDQKEIQERLQEAKSKLDETLNNPKWKEEFEKSMAFNKVDMEKNMQKIQREMEKLKVDMDHKKFDFKKQMDRASVELDKAREEMKGYQEMIYDMEKEGLLNTDEDYSIEYKDGDLYVNDKKLPDETTNRYKKYFKKDKITINKENGDMHIHHQSDKHLD